MQRTTILLADGHTLVMEGIRKLLEPGYSVVGTAEDGNALIEGATKLCPDVIVSEIALPSSSGIEIMKTLQERGCTARFIFLTRYTDSTYANDAFEAGASGYLIKESTLAELRTAIQEVLRGRVYVTPRIAGDLIRDYGGKNCEGRDSGSELSSRQREVLTLLTDGFTVRKIAETMAISSRTVEYHKYEMMKKLSVGTTPELILHAIKNGIVPSK